jgi:hypothetical protein
MPGLLRRTTTAGLLVVFLLAEPATPPYWKSSSARFPFAYMQLDCSPDDGIALNFYFTARKSECGKYSEPFVEISIWRSLPKSVPYTIDVRGWDGIAVRCLKPGACETATSATLHLDKFIQGVSSSGEYELHFKDGSVEKDKFDATACHVYFLCG